MNTCGGWEAARERVRQRVGVRAFGTWFSEVSGDLRERVLVLECPDVFVRDWLAARYGDVLRESAPEAQRVELRVAGEGARAPAARAAGQARPDRAGAPQGVPAASTASPPELDFDGFVAGPQNALALEAARAIADGRAGRCNPLLLVGPSGVGKTHLCQAIVRGLEDAVVYRSSEEFTSEVTQAIRADRMPAVRERYRRAANVLILEDVQFLRGKRATQAELFHTLDHLVARGRPVVLTADRLPQELEELDPNLSSRMAAGLVAHIGPPELQTRRAILKSRAAGGGIRLPDDCLELLAARPTTSVRALVAGLNQVVARATLLRRQLSLELVREALAAVELPGRRCTLDEIRELVARTYSLSQDELASRSKVHRIARPRQLGMYLCRWLTDASLKEIARAFGRSDHTSVVYAVHAVEKRTAAKPQLRYELEALAAKLGGNLPRPGSR